MESIQYCDDRPIDIGDYLDDIKSVSPVYDRDGQYKIRRWALIIVDVQNDFISGSMALNRFFDGEEAGEVVPAINRLLQYVHFDLVIYTRDWHPYDHCSFLSSNVKPKESNILRWPQHCVKGSWGAQFPNELQTNPKCEQIIQVLKGIRRDEECYSAFRGIVQNGKNERLEDYIKTKFINQVFVCGLATDYCVRETCKDSIRLGQNWQTYLLVDASRGVTKFNPETFKKEIGNIRFTTTDRLIRSVLIKKEKLLVHTDDDEEN